MTVRVEALAQLKEGMTLADAQSALDTSDQPVAEQDDDIVLHVLKAPQHGVEVFFKDDTVDTVSFRRPFSGAVRGVRIGATTDDVERLLGEPQRDWPIEDGIRRWIYEDPEFIRVDFDPDTDTVDAIYR